jgi:hypothetical protein
MRPVGTAAAPGPSFWFPPMPVGRIAALRVVGYLFVLLDLVWWTPWVRPHREIDAFYQPLAVGRLLHLPVPTPGFVDALEILLVASATLALLLALGVRQRTSDRVVRGLGVCVALLYAEWMVVAMSYGKVDHDRFALLVLLAGVATVGPARLGEMRREEGAGWAIRVIQLAVVATYFLAAVAKFRFGGFGWVNGSTLVWAIIRRGTPIGEPLLHVPQLLHVSQWGIVAMELGTPLLLVLDHLAGVRGFAWHREAGRLRTAYLWGLFAFHVLTFAAISILFLPHVVCLLAFAPLERSAAGFASVRDRLRRRLGRPWGDDARISRPVARPPRAVTGSRSAARGAPESGRRSA